MNPTIASLVCACGIAGLLYLDREKSSRCSVALWIPGLWITVVGSRAVSQWFGFQPGSNAQLEGSPLDAAFYALLMAMAVIVLVRRRGQTSALLLNNRAIFVYFFYCLISVAWSYYPEISFKRWIKATGDLAIVLVIATDPHPLAAIRRTVSRVGFVLLPMSVLLIKYYGELGRGYTADGVMMNYGVTTNKNTLGLTVFVISLVALWNVRALLTQKDVPNRVRRLIAQGVLLAFGVALLGMANSATAIACFLLGSFVLIVSSSRSVRRRPNRIHSLFLGILIFTGLLLLFGGYTGVIGALGRESHITGRTEIWSALSDSVKYPVIGSGFEIFWISPNVLAFQEHLLARGWDPALVVVLNSAHNGYIDAYLNLGWIGVGLIAAILVTGYFTACRAFQKDPDAGSLILAFLSTATAYSISEAGFRMLNLSWIFLLLVVVTAVSVEKDLFARNDVNLRMFRNPKSTRRKGVWRNVPRAPSTVTRLGALGESRRRSRFSSRPWR